MPASPDVLSLIADGKLIAQYAVRTGMNLSINTLLPGFEAKYTADASTPEELAAFLDAMRQATDAIKPVTLIDLNSTWRGFDNDKPGGVICGAGVKYVLAFCAILLMVFIGYYTQRFNTLRDAAVALEQVRAEHPGQLLAQAIELETRALQPQASAESQQLWKSAQDKLADLHYKRAIALQPVLKLEDQSLQSLLAPVARFAWSVVSTPTVTKGTTEDIFNLPKLSADDAANPLLATPLSSLLGRHSWNFLDEAYDLLLIDKHNDLRATLDALGTWILPGLYGLFGAAIYYIRRILNPLRPNLELSRVIMRIALGGFAGAFTAWVLAPSVDQIAFGQTFSLPRFGICMMMGYAAELFFRLLDNLVAALSVMIDKIGANNPARAGG